jgi:hypothetical protein
MDLAPAKWHQLMAYHHLFETNRARRRICTVLNVLGSDSISERCIGRILRSQVVLHATAICSTVDPHQDYRVIAACLSVS